MKICILGSAPSTLPLAPIGDPSYKIWGCSPGAFPAARRCDAWFELHRWEPGQIGRAETQKPWYSPEYVAWMALRNPRECPVWMYEPVPEIPASRALPINDLISKYGSAFFTSSISIMIACAIEDIRESRIGRPNPEQDEIALFGVDMSATEEWGFQRAGCQHFLEIASLLGIAIRVPPESDLLRPMPIYGICESSHWHIKNTARKRELESRLQQAKMMLHQAHDTVQFLSGAMDDHNYHMQTWCEDRDFASIAPEILAEMPKVITAVIGAQKTAEVVDTPHVETK